MKTAFQLFCLGKMENKKTEKDKGIHTRMHCQAAAALLYTTPSKAIWWHGNDNVCYSRQSFRSEETAVLLQNNFLIRKSCKGHRFFSTVVVISELWSLSSVFASHKRVFLNTPWARTHTLTNLLWRQKKKISRVESNLGGQNYRTTDFLAFPHCSSRCLYHSFLNCSINKRTVLEYCTVTNVFIDWSLKRY